MCKVECSALPNAEQFLIQRIDDKLFMLIHIKRYIAVLLLVFTTAAGAQVLLPEEVKDGNARALQQKYMPQLKAIGEELEAHRFPYHFYFSRMLDIDEERQIKADQRSIRFEKHQGHTVLAITGNYFAAYSSVLMGKNERVKKTMEDVVIPILQSAAPLFAADDSFVSFAIEVSHHVRRKVMGMSAENPENMMFVVPRAAARHMIAAANPQQVQAALLDSEVYVDAELFDLWVDGKRPPDEELQRVRDDKRQRQHGTTGAGNVLALPVSASVPVSEKLVRVEAVNRLVLPQTLANLNLSYADPIARLVDGVKEQAHWVPLAPPSFNFQLKLGWNLRQKLRATNVPLLRLMITSRISSAPRLRISKMRRISTEFPIAQRLSRQQTPIHKRSSSTFHSKLWSASHVTIAPARI
jgi:hypothetical protein